jgi:hypothetical protein
MTTKTLFYYFALLSLNLAAMFLTQVSPDLLLDGSWF